MDTTNKRRTIEPMRQAIYFFIISALGSCLIPKASNNPKIGHLHISPMFKNQPLEIGKTYEMGGGDSIKIATLRFYISNITAFSNAQNKFSLAGKYFLIDAENTSTLSIPWSDLKKTYDSISFSIGLDSITNTSGARGGDLDPSFGMYWTWNSGYINTKIEGTGSECNTRKKEFTFHLGGYQAPYYGKREIRMALNKKNQQTLYIKVDLFLQAMDLKSKPMIMSPCTEAMSAADAFSRSFFMKK